MQRLLPNELLQILAMGWVFESFLQGITGFGVPVAVGAPLLIGIGVGPVYAVIIPLICQAWGNTFGTLAAAWDALANFGGLTAGTPLYWKTAFWAALFLWIWDVATGFIVCWFYGKGKAVKKGFAAVLILSTIQGGGEFLLSQVNTTLCCFFPSLISLAAIFLLGRMKTYSEPWRIDDSPIMNRKAAKTETAALPKGMTLVHAFIPYVFLSAVTLIVLLVPPVHKAASAFTVGLSFPKEVTGYGYTTAAVSAYSAFAPLSHASFFLFLSAVVGLVYYKHKGWIQTGGTGRHHVEGHGRHRADHRAGGRHLRRARNGIRRLIALCRAPRHLYDGLEYELEYPVRQFPDDLGEAAPRQPGSRARRTDGRRVDRRGDQSVEDHPRDDDGGHPRQRRGSPQKGDAGRDSGGGGRRGAVPHRCAAVERGRYVIIF